MKNNIFITDSSKQLYDAFKGNLNLLNIDSIPIEMASCIKHIELYSKNTTLCQICISLPDTEEVAVTLKKVMEKSTQYKLYYSIKELSVDDGNLIIVGNNFIGGMQLAQLLLKDFMCFEPAISLYINYVIAPNASGNKQEDMVYTLYPLSALQEVNTAITSGLITINNPIKYYNNAILAMIFKTVYESHGLIQVNLNVDIDLEESYQIIYDSILKYYGLKIRYEEVLPYIGSLTN